MIRRSQLSHSPPGLPSTLSADTFGDITLTPLVHSSVQIEYAGKVIQVDPWSRADLSRAKTADLILITDDPLHHLDPKAIARAAQARRAHRHSTLGTARPVSSNAMKQVPDGITLANGESQTVAGREDRSHRRVRSDARRAVSSEGRSERLHHHAWATRESILRASRSASPKFAASRTSRSPSSP